MVGRDPRTPGARGVVSDTYTSLIRFAPLTTLDRVNDPAWKAEGRTLYDSSSLTFVPGQTTCPLIIDHDDTKQIGVVRSIARFEDVDGPWLAAVATIYDRPAWLKKYDTKVSFRYKPAGTSNDVFGCQIVRRGLIEEVSVLSPGVEPAEPGAKVLTINRDEAAALKPGDRVTHGGPMIYRPGIGQVLAIR
jgi:hypothetical protein